MANQPEIPNYDSGVYQLEQSDPVIGGVGGVSNAPLLNLANRTTYLKQEQDALKGQQAINTPDIAQNATDITALKNALPSHLRHTILTGPVSSIDGVENALQIIGPASNRSVGLNDSASGGPVTFAFSNGYTITGLISASDYIRYTPSAPATNVILPASAGTYFVFAKFDGISLVTFDYASTSQAYTISPTQPTTGIQNRHIWFDPVKSVHHFTTDGGGVWTQTILVPVGLAVVDGSNNVTSVTTFEYQREPYDTQTKPGTVIWLAYQDTLVLNGGWFVADGSNKKILEYPRLAKVLGTTYGSPGSGDFTLPDLRAEFIRGLDLGRGIDAGRVLGSNQAGAIESHAHGLSPIEVQSGSGEIVADDSPISPTGSTGSTGGTETRPRNIALVPYIKY